MGVVSAPLDKGDVARAPVARRSGGGPGRILALPGAIARGFARLPLKAKIGIAILSMFVLVAIIGPWIAPYDPSTTTTQAIPLAPNSHHLLGTDSTGRDILSQMLVGTRSTVVLALLTGLIATVLSVIVGITAGYVGSWADEGLSLLSNVFLVLPALPLLIVILGYLPDASEVVVAFVLAMLGWAWGARVIRAQTLSLSNRDFIQAAREMGERPARVIFFELLPNQTGLIAASFVGVVLYAILTSVALAFIGVTNTAQWSYGVILYWAQSQSAIQLGAWWWYVFPGVAVALLGMSLVLINFGLDELSNPRLRVSRSARRVGRRTWRPTDPTPVVGDYVKDAA